MPSGVKVNVQPNISATDGGAATKDDAAKSDRPDETAKKETLVQAIVGAAQTVRIEWTAKAEGAAGLAALVTVQARQEVTIDEIGNRSSRCCHRGETITRPTSG